MNSESLVEKNSYANKSLETRNKIKSCHFESGAGLCWCCLDVHRNTFTAVVGDLFFDTYYFQTVLDTYKIVIIPPPPPTPPPIN